MEKQYKLVLDMNDLNVLGQALGNLQVPVKDAPVVQKLISKIQTQMQEQDRDKEE